MSRKKTTTKTKTAPKGIPITPIKLERQYHEIVDDLREKIGVRTLADVVRMALKRMHAQEFPEKNTRVS